MAKKRATEDDLKNWGLVWDEKEKMFVKKRKPEQHMVVQRKKIEPNPEVPEIINTQYTPLEKKPILLNNLIIAFHVDPIGKPRMTQSDKWKKRDATDKYWIYKDQLKKIASGYNFTLPESGIHMIFRMPMPDSWSKNKKEEMAGTPHRSKPDADNILKGVQDALCDNDSYIWDVRITKEWSYYGVILIYAI